MLDKLTENMKFLILIIVYIGSISWWASGIQVTQQQMFSKQQEIYSSQQGILVLINTHLLECSKHTSAVAVLEAKVDRMRVDVDKLMEK